MTGRLAPALAVLALALVAAGCGEKQEHTGGDSEPIDVGTRLLRQSRPRRYLHRRSTVATSTRPASRSTRRVPSDPSAPIQQVAAGRADLAISYEPEVLLARDQGLPVSAVAALVPQPLTSLISLPKAGIADPVDLAGKTVATAGIPYQADFLDAILERAGIDPDDVTQQDVGLNLLPAVLSGSADAMLGGFLNVEGVDLAERGLDPRVVPVDRLGIPTYDELVLVASTDRIADDPEPIRLFIAALERGTARRRARPAGRDRGDPRRRRWARAEADPGRGRAARCRCSPERGPRAYGYMDAREWERFAGFFADRGLISTRPTAEQMFTDELLPGQVPQ